MTAHNDHDILVLMISGLAEIRATTVTDIEEEIAAQGGDLIMDSYEAVVLITLLEERLGRDLPSIEDLAIDQESSLTALAALLERELRSAPAA